MYLLLPEEITVQKPLKLFVPAVICSPSPAMCNDHVARWTQTKRPTFSDFDDNQPP